MDQQWLRRNRTRCLAMSAAAVVAAWWMRDIRAPIKLPPVPRSPIKLQAWLMTTPAPSPPWR